MDYPAPTLDEVHTALTFISADCSREEWLTVGNALKAEFGDNGFDLFDSWSETGGGYKPGEVRAVWKSFKSVKIPIDAVFKRAIAGGYKSEKIELSHAEKEERQRISMKRRRAAELRAVADAEHEKKWGDVVAKCAQGIMARCGNEGSSPYFENKKVFGFGVSYPMKAFAVEFFENEYRYEFISDRGAISALFDRKKIDGDSVSLVYLKRGTVVVPLVDESLALRSVQILHVTNKTFLPAPTSGLFHVLGEPSEDSPILVTEGYSTAASCRMATGWPTVMALNCYGLQRVCGFMRARFPRAPIVVAGDDDSHNEHKKGGNGGKKYSEGAAASVGGIAVLPAFNTGVNDAA